VGRLKEELEKRFPGKIPASLQRLFKGTQLLPSSMTLEEASEASFGKNRLDSVPSAMVPHEWELGGRLRTEKSCAFGDCDDC